MKTALWSSSTNMEIGRWVAQRRKQTELHTLIVAAVERMLTNIYSMLPFLDSSSEGVSLQAWYRLLHSASVDFGTLEIPFLVAASSCKTTFPPGVYWQQNKLKITLVCFELKVFINQNKQHCSNVLAHFLSCLQYKYIFTLSTVSAPIFKFLLSDLTALTRSGII